MKIFALVAIVVFLLALIGVLFLIALLHALIQESDEAPDDKNL